VAEPLAPQPLDPLDGAPVGRRIVLGMLVAGAAGIAFGGPLQQGLTSVLAPLTARDPSGLSSLLPTGNGFRIYSVVGFLPRRTRSAYRLRVTGLVDTPLDLTYDDVRALPRTRLVRDFQCVTGWRVDDVPWTGVRLSELLEAAGVQADGRAITFRSFDGAYTESLTLRQARRDDILVAYEMFDEPITSAHGGPVRLYVAPMYGYKSCKWLDEIVVTSEVQPGYWEKRGYDIDAWIGRSNGRDDEPV
jgi:DMSO/TMAO reductase YedYZ molybdopterin-dependent catalytic subunit